MVEFRCESRDWVQMMFTSYSSVENLIPHFREELSTDSYNVSAFLVLWGRENTVLHITSDTLLIPYFIYFQFMYTSVGSQAERILGCQDGPL